MNKVKARLATRRIRDCTSWDDFYTKMRALAATDKKAAGDTFEVFVQAYLRTHPEFQLQLSDVWLLHEVPLDVRARLDLGSDEGVDLVARTTHDEFWAIQAKFVGDPDEALTRPMINSFTSYVFHARRDKFAQGYVAHISTKPIKKRKLMPNVCELGLERWRALDNDGGAEWRSIIKTLKREPAQPRPRDPKPHQRRAIGDAVRHFQHETRGRLKMACGTGKSLIGLWVARELEARMILVVAPSLLLIQRAVEDWSREYVAHGEKPDWMCVCSDDTVTDDVDDIVTDTYQAGLPTCTDPKVIAERLRGPGTKIVFTTYQSGDVVAEAARLAGVTFDFAIYDEAHKTVGRRGKMFGRLLPDDFKVKRRMFMTATERVVNGADADEVYSMDDEATYGKRFHTLEFAEAIALGIISPYQVMTITVREGRIKELIKRNRFLDIPGLSVVKARDLAVAVAINEAIEEHGIKKAIAYCASIAAGRDACKRQDALNETGRWAKTANFHVSSKLTAGERADRIRRFEDATQPAIMYNARCLTEGVDIGTQKDRPVDAVAFTSPRRSVIDIVQAAGRAMRKGSKKEVGYILIPIVVPDHLSIDKFAKTTSFKEMARIIRALALADPRIVEELRALYYGKVPSTGIIRHTGDVPIGKRDMSLEEFAAAIRTRVWEVAARGNWLPFEEARAFVRKLGLKDQNAWGRYVQSGKKPADIPSNPHLTYANDGWVNLADWLDSRRSVGKWRPFKQARQFARGLNLKGQADWKKFAKTDKKPVDIPANPYYAYDGDWIDWGDWLGTGFVACSHRTYRPFKEARAFVRRLKLKGLSDWHAYCRSGKKPDDIPSAPRRYAEWVSWLDWIGAGKRHGGWRPFKEARAFARRLNLTSKDQWMEFCKSGKKPNDIPTAPEGIYPAEWVNWFDWLGGGRRIGGWRSFKEARKFARGLNFTSGEQWRKFIKSNKRPVDIPKSPDVIYAEKGWVNLADWLGSETMRGA
jgi:superfamily II DNA or RNA helicase